jgi:hypothetical protein
MEMAPGANSKILNGRKRRFIDELKATYCTSREYVISEHNPALTPETVALPQEFYNWEDFERSGKRK